jgi:hypothetical protein
MVQTPLMSLTSFFISLSKLKRRQIVGNKDGKEKKRVEATTASHALLNDK